jgi:hypothetical protein
MFHQRFDVLRNSFFFFFFWWGLKIGQANVDTTVGKEFLARKEDTKGSQERETNHFLPLLFSDVWCDCADEEPGMVYLNLLLNPERYTGYVG